MLRPICWRASYAVALAALLALPAAGIAANRGFDGLYGQDAYAYFDYAATSVRASILQVRPLEAFFWPPGYPLLVALVSMVTGPVALAGQLVSLLMGALVPVFTALLARELWGAETVLALLAGALVAVCGQLWQSSVVVMADTTGLALATLSAWALARYVRDRRLRWLLLGTAALAYATLARWIYGLVAIPFAIYALWAMNARANPGRAVVHGLAALGVAAALLMPVLAQPLLGLLSHPAEPASFAGNFQVYSWSPMNAVRRDFFTADGHLSYSLPNGAYYAVAAANPAFLGPLLAPWAIVGAWALLRNARLRSEDWKRLELSAATGAIAVGPALLIVGWLAIVYAFHAGAPWQNFRFTLAYLPPSAILTALGLTWTWRHVNRRLGLAVVMCAAVGLVISAASAVRLVQGFIDRKDEDLGLVHWVEAQSAPNARLFSFGPTLTLRHYTNLLTFDLFDLSAADVRSILATPAPTYVLLDERSVESQWLDQPPSTNFHLLRDSGGLQPIGADGSYTLYRLGSE